MNSYQWLVGAKRMREYNETLTIDTISVQLRRGASHIPLKMVSHFRFDGYTLLGVC